MTHVHSDPVGDDRRKAGDVCEKCGGAMKLTHIVPGKPGHEVRSSRCTACGAEKIERAKIG